MLIGLLFPLHILELKDDCGELSPYGGSCEVGW